jgi:thioredoxin-like negative regulator of GroEL
MLGATVLGPDPQPASTPLALLRVDEAGAAAALEGDCYLAPDGAALAADLARLGVATGRGAALAEALLAFLARTRRGAALSTGEALAAIATCLLDPRAGGPALSPGEPVRRRPAARFG